MLPIAEPSNKDINAKIDSKVSKIKNIKDA